MRYILRFSNILVLLGSIIIIVVLSLETLNNIEPYQNKAYMQVQFWVCIAFLLDFFVRFAVSEKKGRFLWHNLLFLIVSIPILNIAAYFDWHMSSEVYYFMKGFPLVRGAFGIGVIVGWITNTKIATLFVSYIVIILSFTYFSSIVFYITEKGVNPMVHKFWNAVCWAFMNVTTVGSDIFAVRVPGQILAILLAASGMMLFPIFTAYITTKFQSGYNKRHNPEQKKAVPESKNT